MAMAIAFQIVVRAALGLTRCGNDLANFNQIAIRIAHIASNLKAVILWLCQELRASVLPIFITRHDIRDSNIHKATNLIWALRWAQRYSWLVIRWSASDIYDHPTVCEFNNTGLTAANDLSTQNARIEISRACGIRDRQKMREHESFFWWY